MHRRRALIVGIALHAALLAALICGMLLDLTDGHSRHLGPTLISAYVAASFAISAVMFWPALVPRRRPRARRVDPID